MAGRHPPSILVIAILHLIGGIAGLGVDLCGLGMQAATQGNPGAFQFGPPNPQQQKQLEYQKALQDHLEREMPASTAVNYGAGILNLLLDVMLISAGVGLLYLKPWARTLSIIYAVLSLLEKAVVLVYGALTIPVLSSFLEAQGQADPSLAMLGNFAMIGVVTGIVVNVLLGIYPVVVLVVMTRPSVKAAFEGRGAPEVGPEAEERWEEGRYRDEPPPETYTREP